MIAACVTLVAALLTGASPPADGTAPVSDPMADAATSAEAEAARGEALFLERRFEEASAAYERAYELKPTPAYLFARARCEQEAHRCAKAIEIYERFKETNPSVSDLDRANMEIGRCHSEVGPAAPRPKPAVVAPAPPIAVDPPLPPPPPPPPPPNAIHDPVGGGLLGAGLIVLATGLGLFFAGDATNRRADRAATTDDFRKLTGRARTLEGVGIAGISVGSVLLVAAITRFAIVARRAKRARH